MIKLLTAVYFLLKKKNLTVFFSILNIFEIIKKKCKSHDVLFCYFFISYVK